MSQKESNFTITMERFRVLFDLKNESTVADKLGLSRGNYSDRKQRDSVPYENIINFCKKEKVSTDLIFHGKNCLELQDDFADKIKEIISTLSNEECKYFYYLIESELAKKKL